MSFKCICKKLFRTRKSLEKHQQECIPKTIEQTTDQIYLDLTIFQRYIDDLNSILQDIDIVRHNNTDLSKISKTDLEQLVQCQKFTMFIKLQTDKIRSNDILSLHTIDEHEDENEDDN